MDDELDYRTPLATRPAPQQVSSTDEQNYDTIKIVYEQFRREYNGLYKDFNAFKLLENATDAEARDTILRKIAGKQEAYDILEPLMTMLEGTLDDINAKYKE